MHVHVQWNNYKARHLGIPNVNANHSLNEDYTLICVVDNHNPIPQGWLASGVC